MKVNIIYQFHPAAALHQPRLWATILDDWANLPEKADANYTVDRPRSGYDVPLALDTENAIDGTLGEWSVAYRGKDGELLVCPYIGTVKNMTFHQPVVFHNARWDIRVMRDNGMKVPEQVLDTMIAAYCLGLGKQDITAKEGRDVGMVGGLGLKYLARRHLGMEMKTWQQVKDQEHGVKRDYNIDDSVSTLLLWEKFEPLLPQHFWDIDMPLLGTLMAMEDRGIGIDPAFLGRFDEYLEEEIAKIDLPLNPFSVPQLRSYVYEKLKVEPTKFTASGEPSVDSSVLETIDDPVLKQVLRYKELYKEKGTYVKNYLAKMTIDSRIHPEFKQTSTATGRLSSANPNLQNVPTEGEMRKLFVAPEGKRIIRVDWNQLELRVFAAITGDEVMLDIFNKGGDIHQHTADALGVVRRDAKTVNFLTLYGGDAWKISQEFHVPIEEARAWQRRYYAKFPMVKQYFEEMKEIAKTQRKVVNHFGRVRRLDAMYADDWRVVNQGFREAINTPIQCLGFGTRILTNKLQWQCVETLKEGDELVAFDEEGRGFARRWRKSEVISTEHDMDEVLRVTFDDGVTVDATPEHKWLVYGGRHYHWLRTDKLIVGRSRLPTVFPVWEEATTKEAGYLAGAFDSDGCVSYRRGKRSVPAQVKFAQKQNEVQDTIERNLNQLGFEFGKCVSNSSRGYTWVNTWLKGGLPTVLRFLGQVRPTRLLNNFDIERIQARFFNKGCSYRRVVKVQRLPKQRIVRLATTTKTFFAEGMPSHNSAAADAVKIVMNKLHYEHHAPMVLQVHDELLFEVSTRSAKRYADWLKEYIPTIIDINGVRFPVDVGVGANWVEAKEDAK